MTHTDHLKKQIEDLEKQLQKKNHEIENLYSLIDKIIQPGLVVNSNDLLIDDSDNPKIFKEVAVLSEGAAFGELALIYDKPRMATIKCVERSHFIVLSK